MFNIFGLRVSQRHTETFKSVVEKDVKIGVAKVFDLHYRTISSTYRNKKIRISKTSSTTSCPVAHTCFNRLDLPDYNDKDKLSRMLRISLDN